MSEDKATVTIKKDVLWKLAFGIIVILFIVSLFTGGFRGGSNSNSGSNDGNNGGSGDEIDVDLSPFLSNSALYPSLGPENAGTTVIEFSDFQCPYCAMASGLPSWVSSYEDQFGDLIGVAQDVKEKASNGELRFIYVPMSFLGDESVFAAQAALCANKQSKFWEMHDAIFKAHDSRENNGKYSKANLKILAEGISGLNFKSFSDCLDKDETSDDAYQAASEASRAASATPTFYVNGERVSASRRALSVAIA